MAGMVWAARGRLQVRCMMASISRSSHMLSTVLPLIARNMLPAMANMAFVAACAGWTLKKPAMAVVSSRNVCRLLIRGQYLVRMDFIPMELPIPDEPYRSSTSPIQFIVPDQPTLAMLILIDFH